MLKFLIILSLSFAVMACQARVVPKYGSVCVYDLKTKTTSEAIVQKFNGKWFLHDTRMVPGKPYALLVLISVEKLPEVGYVLCRNSVRR